MAGNVITFGVSSDTLTVQFRGLEDVLANLRRFQGRKLDGVSRAIQLTTRGIEASAKKNAPRDPARPPKDPSRPVTGELKRSISASFERSPDRILGVVSTGVEYGVYQELGAPEIGLPARPYLRPALEQGRRVILSHLRAEGRRGGS